MAHNPLLGLLVVVVNRWEGWGSVSRARIRRNFVPSVQFPVQGEKFRFLHFLEIFAFCSYNKNFKQFSLNSFSGNRMSNVNKIFRSFTIHFSRKFVFLPCLIYGTNINSQVLKYCSYNILYWAGSEHNTPNCLISNTFNTSFIE